jgi:hypothetical protein
MPTKPPGKGEVERFSAIHKLNNDLSGRGCAPEAMFFDPEGAWVRFSDLQAREAELEAERDQIRGAVDLREEERCDEAERANRAEAKLAEACAELEPIISYVEGEDQDDEVVLDGVLVPKRVFSAVGLLDSPPSTEKEQAEIKPDCGCVMHLQKCACQERCGGTGNIVTTVEQGDTFQPCRSTGCHESNKEPKTCLGSPPPESKNFLRDAADLGRRADALEAILNPKAGSK